MKDRSEESEKGLAINILALHFILVSSLIFGVATSFVGFGEKGTMMMGSLAFRMYMLSSLQVSFILKRYLDEELSWTPFHVLLVLFLSLIILLDMLCMMGLEPLQYSMFLKGGIIAGFILFCHTVYVLYARCSWKKEDEEIRMEKELLFYVLLLVLYGFLFSLYLADPTMLFDFFVVTMCYVIVNLWILYKISLKGEQLTGGGLLRPCKVKLSDMQEEEFKQQREMEISRMEKRLSDYMEECVTHRFSTLRENIVVYGAADFDDASLSLKEKLLQYMEQEKPFLSQNISVNELAVRLFTNRTYLSKTINTEMNRNFRELVNYYRIKEAISIFLSDMNLSTRELGRMCGFKNNTSFNNCFKNFTGITPGEWCRGVRKGNKNFINLQI